MVSKKRVAVDVIHHLDTRCDARSPGASIKYTSSVDKRILDQVYNCAVHDAATARVHGEEAAPGAHSQGLFLLAAPEDAPFRDVWWGRLTRRKDRRNGTGFPKRQPCWRPTTFLAGAGAAKWFTARGGDACHLHKPQMAGERWRMRLVGSFMACFLEALHYCRSDVLLSGVVKRLGTLLRRWVYMYFRLPSLRDGATYQPTLNP